MTNKTDLPDNQDVDLNVPDIGDDDPNVFTSDVDVPGYKPPEGDDPDEGKKSDDKKVSPPKGGDDGDDDPGTDLKSRLEALEKSQEHATQHIKDLNKALSEARQENKSLKKSFKDKSGDDVFSDSQLMQIMEENKDDPGVMFQAMKQLIKQSSADLKDLTDKKVEISRKQTEVDGVMSGWKDYISNNQGDVNKAIEYHDLQDHFAKDHLALGSIIVAKWPEIVKGIQEKAKQEALSGISENARKKTIKDNQPATGGSETSSGDNTTPRQWVETAKRLGFDQKQSERYYAMMAKSSSKKKGD